MDASNNRQYTSLCLDNAHGVQGLQIDHEEVYEPIEEYIIQQQLTEVSDGNISQDVIETKVALQISHENSKEEEPYSFVYPIYVKKDLLKQFTTGDESMAVEALRQLREMHPKIENKKVSCSNCTNVFTQTEFIKHRILCQSDKHICKICDRIFQRKIELNNHMICHEIEHPHVCRTCGYLFCSKANLQAHMIEIHQVEQVHKCKVCGTNFQRPSSLSNHMKIHSYVAGRAIAIPQPNIAVQTIESNDTHSKESVLTTIETVQNIETSQVEWMMETYNFTNDKNSIHAMVSSPSNIDNLQEVNMLPTEEVAQFEYILQDAVNRDIDQQYHLNLNLLNNSETSIKLLSVESQTKNNLYLCNKCNISFGNQVSLIEHEKYHIKNNWQFQSKCEYCDEQFQDFDFLRVHQISCKLIQNNQKKVKTNFPNTKWGKHACPKCGKKFTTKQKMFRHQWIHRKKTYSCETCNSQFEKQLELDEHRLLTHLTESPFTCSECGKSFVSRQGLWEHGRTHVGSPAHFHCDTCSKTFSSRQGYLIHHRTHTGERPYGCKFCWKAFRDGGTLRKHERIHTGERPHVCPLCLRAFNQKVVLREHVRWVHAAKNNTAVGGPPFSCPLCDTSIQDHDELCAHIVKHSDLMIAEAKAKTKCQVVNTKVKKKTKSHNNKQDKFIHIENIEAQIVNDTKQDKESFYITRHAGNSTKIKDTYPISKDKFDDSFCLQASPNNISRDDRSTKSISKFTISKVLDLQLQEDINVLHKESNSKTVHFIPLTRASERIYFTSATESNILTLISKHNDNLPVLTIPNSPTIMSFSNGLSNIDTTLSSKTSNIQSITEEISLDKNGRFNSEDTSENESEELVCGICGNECSDKNSLMEHVKIHI